MAFLCTSAAVWPRACAAMPLAWGARAASFFATWPSSSSAASTWPLAVADTSGVAASHTASASTRPAWYSAATACSAMPAVGAMRLWHSAR